MEKFIQDSTTKQLYRMYCRLYNRIAEQGGAMFGLSFNTIAQTNPDSCKLMKRILLEFKIRAEQPANYYNQN